ncbi:MAG: hypothetical protein RLZZ314_297, partial [Bacteroidota bacterium]
QTIAPVKVKRLAIQIQGPKLLHPPNPKPLSRVAVPIVHKLQHLVVPAHTVAVRELTLRTCRGTIAPVPAKTFARKIGQGSVVAHPIAKKRIRDAVSVAIFLQAVGTIPAIPLVPIELAAHEVRRKRHAVVAHAVPHPRRRVAVAIAIGDFTRRTLGCCQEGKQNHRHKKQRVAHQAKVAFSRPMLAYSCEVKRGIQSNFVRQCGYVCHGAIGTSRYERIHPPQLG